MTGRARAMLRAPDVIVTVSDSPATLEAVISCVS